MGKPQSRGCQVKMRGLPVRVIHGQARVRFEDFALQFGRFRDYGQGMATRWLGVMVAVTAIACAGPQQPARDPDPVAQLAQVPPASTPAVSAVRAEPAPASPPSSAWEKLTGIRQCDEYLDLYKRCEKRMEPEIAAGNAIRHQNEAARLKYLQGTPEAPGLPQACASMLAGLHNKCGP